MSTAMPTRSIDNLKQPSALIKLVEIALLLIALITYAAGYEHIFVNWYVGGIITACFVNAVVILTLYALGYTQIKTIPLELILYSYYTVALLVSSIVLMTKPFSNLICSGVFCLFATPVYCYDIYLCYRHLASRMTPPQNTDQQLQNNQQPAVISNDPPAVLDPNTLPSQPPPPYAGADTVDLAAGARMASSALYHSNPVYPSMFNFPPDNQGTKGTMPAP